MTFGGVAAGKEQIMSILVHLIEMHGHGYRNPERRRVSGGL